MVLTTPWWWLLVALATSLLLVMMLATGVSSPLMMAGIAAMMPTGLFPDDGRSLVMAAIGRLHLGNHRSVNMAVVPVPVDTSSSGSCRSAPSVSWESPHPGSIALIVRPFQAGHSDMLYRGLQIRIVQ